MATFSLGNLRDQLRAGLDVLGFDRPGHNGIRQLWDRLSGVPGGSKVFSLLVGRAARYTGTIRAQVLSLEVGQSKVEMADSPRVRNHLRSVHAVALVNLAELAGNVALAYSLPDDARFIVAGLEMEYVKKARGTITALGKPPPVTTAEKKEYPVPVELRDASGDVVARCTLRTLVGPKKGAAA